MKVSPSKAKKRKVRDGGEHRKKTEEEMTLKIIA